MLLLKNISILFAVFVTTTLANAQLADLPEKYNKEILIKAKWGNGPGEFQLEPMNETHTWTTFLALDKQGNIYIADPNNYRINVFDRNGSYINTLVIAESDVLEKNKLPPENRGNLINNIVADTEGHLYIALSAFGVDLTILEIDKTGEKVDKYYFPRAWTNDFNLYEDKNNKYLSGTWSLFSKNKPIGQDVVTAFAVVPLSLGKTNKDKNSFEVVDKIKEISKQNQILPKYKIFKNGYSGYYSGSGDVTIKNNKGKIIFKEHHSDLIENHRVSYKPGQSASVGARIVFDNEGNFYVIQCKQEGLEVLKYSLRPENIK